tara:strand:- start:603 stop:1115 length:513 start_codon:yes stop_codon:yes gene_type:complete
MQKKLFLCGVSLYAMPMSDQNHVRCSICERQFSQDELKEADDFDPQGNHRYLNICGECEDDFDKIDITFNFKANDKCPPTAMRKLEFAPETLEAFKQIAAAAEGNEAVLCATTCYRLLDCDDKIRGTDEFLEDDATHWSRIDRDHSWNIGSYWHSALKPMRRISGDKTKK